MEIFIILIYLKLLLVICLLLKINISNILIINYMFFMMLVFSISFNNVLILNIESSINNNNIYKNKLNYKKKFLMIVVN